NKTIDSINLAKSEIVGEIAKNTNAINGLSSDIRAVDSSVDAVNASVNSVKGSVDAVNDTLTTNLTTINDSVVGVGDSVDGLGEKMDGISNELADIGDSIDGLSNLELNRQGICSYNGALENCNGYYEPQYPEGFTGIAERHFEQLQTQVTSVVDGMFTLDVSNASAPSFCMNIMQFGNHCFTDYMNLSAIFAFIRACMMFGAVMLCRQLVFGG
ncbi:hypothetical protein, partial [Vibrio parahaemolyticus]|uniref:hypothetical protein n=1 Tax=Vibrio parahaemolyticus TaxID=670 RepID=UPI00215CA3E2